MLWLALWRHPSAHAPRKNSRRVRLSVKKSHVGRPASHTMMALKALLYFDGCACSYITGEHRTPNSLGCMSGKCQQQCMIWGSVHGRRPEYTAAPKHNKQYALRSSPTEALLLTRVLAVILFCLLLGLGCQELDLHSITTCTAWQQLRPSPPNKCMLLSSINLQVAHKLAPAMHCAAAP